METKHFAINIVFMVTKPQLLNTENIALFISDIGHCSDAHTQS